MISRLLRRMKVYRRDSHVECQAQATRRFQAQADRAVGGACFSFQRAEPRQSHGGTVSSGSASFASAGNTLTITNSHNAIINWQRLLDRRQRDNAVLASPRMLGGASTAWWARTE